MGFHSLWRRLSSIFQCHFSIYNNLAFEKCRLHGIRAYQPQYTQYIVEKYKISEFTAQHEISFVPLWKAIKIWEEKWILSKNEQQQKPQNLRDEILEFIAFFHQVFSYWMNFSYNSALASLYAMSELYCDNELDIVENEKEYHDHEKHESKRWFMFDEEFSILFSLFDFLSTSMIFSHLLSNLSSWIGWIRNLPYPADSWDFFFKSIYFSINFRIIKI